MAANSNDIFTHNNSMVHYQLVNQKRDNYVTLLDVYQKNYLTLHIHELIKQRKIIDAMSSYDAFIVGIIAGHDTYVPRVKALKEVEVDE